MSIWFYVFLFSLIFNAIGLYYIRWLLKSIVVINEDILNLNELIAKFSEHLNSVHDMEMFYGDETLQFLLQHTNSLSTMLESFEEIGDIVSPLVLEEGEGEQQEEKNNNAEKTITEQDVFYGGTRTSNS